LDEFDVVVAVVDVDVIVEEGVELVAVVDDLVDVTLRKQVLIRVYHLAGSAGIIEVLVNDEGDGEENLVIDCFHC
jgi:hypothetical protein